jgi:hypothetical protein
MGFNGCIPSNLLIAIHSSKGAQWAKIMLQV